MAVTQNKKQVVDAQKGGQAQNLTPKVNPYSGMVGVSQNTGQHVGQLQQGYQQGQSVTAAQNVWNQIQQQKPGEYQSRYGEQLDSILQQIQNPQEFRYEFNGDNLFKGYADLYSQIGTNSMSWTLAVNGSSASSPADTGDLLPENRLELTETQEFPVTLTLVDGLETTVITAKLPSARYVLAFDATGNKIGVMKFPNKTIPSGKNRTFEFSADTQIYIGDDTLEAYIANIVSNL